MRLAGAPFVVMLLIGQGKNVQGVKKLDAATRQAVLKAFQNAIGMQRELWIDASSLAEALDYTQEYIEDSIVDSPLPLTPGRN